MLEYSGEFLTGVIKRSKVLFGLTLDLLAAAALAFANLSAFRVWWPLLVVVALLLVLFASFQAFQEVRRKIAPSIDVRVTLQEFGAPMIVIYADGSLQFYAPLGFRFRNNGDVARIVGLRLLWERQPILGGPKAVHVVPLRRDDQSRPFSLEMGKAAVVEKEFLFEGRRASDGKGAGDCPGSHVLSWTWMWWDSRVSSCRWLCTKWRGGSCRQRDTITLSGPLGFYLT